MEKRRENRRVYAAFTVFFCFNSKERESRSARECGIRAAQDHQVQALRREEDELRAEGRLLLILTACSKAPGAAFSARRLSRRSIMIAQSGPLRKLDE